MRMDAVDISSAGSCKLYVTGCGRRYQHHDAVHDSP